jgi:hypothetical protein
MDMRRYLVMEQSAAPMPLNAMMTNIERIEHHGNTINRID